MLCSLAQVSEPALEQERRRSQAVERQRSRQEVRWASVFGQPLETAPGDINDWSATEHGVQGSTHSVASFIVRPDQKSKWSKGVPVHPDSFARTLWDILLLAAILLTILTDPVRCVTLCAHLLHSLLPRHFLPRAGLSLRAAARLLRWPCALAAPCAPDAPPATAITAVDTQQQDWKAKLSFSGRSK